jgi:hypothetical protein
VAVKLACLFNYSGNISPSAVLGCACINEVNFLGPNFYAFKSVCSRVEYVSGTGHLGVFHSRYYDIIML